MALLVLVLPVILLGVLAWRNYAAGRGDRRGALRLAAVVFAIGCLSAASRVRWSFEVTTLVAGAWIALGYAAFPAFLVWALYLGCEPPVRRRWPHLLVSWTRLLDGRWRDPLVGRALLIGLLTGSAWAALPGVIPALGRRWLDWRGARPTYSPFVLNGSIFWAGLPVDMIVTVFWLSLAFIGVLGAARLLLRSNAGAWALFVLVLLLFFGAVAGGGVFPRMPIVLLAGVSIAITALALAAFVRAGLLGLAAAWLVPREILFGAPWTLDPSRWFFWRGAVVFVVLLAIAFWGFRNALGKQSMFPAEKE